MSSLAHLTRRNEILHIESETQLGQMRSSLLAAVQDQERAIKALEKAREQQSDAYAQALASYQDTLDNLSLRLDALIKGGDFVAKSQQLLESLMFAEMPRRHSAIADAYNKTFGWIFEDSGTTFKTWLSSDSGIFWVNGKAGSGKSTLMKYLSDHPKSRSILSGWAMNEKKKIVCASFYFWNSGLPMERTQEGLLQSLLFQVLRRCPHIIPDLFPDRWNGDELSYRYPQPWTRAELSSALAKILDLQESHLSARFCFFIDGLDEYEGDRHQLVIDLKTLSKSSSVKLCVSSRPWTEFRDAFGSDSNRMLVLQDLTRGDMDRFVRGMLGKDERFVQMAKEEPGVQRFIGEVLNKAQGVFLWVFLVVRSLLRGLDKHDDIAILEERLTKLPSKLEEYFARILDSIEDVYQDRAARMFHLIVRGAPLPLTAFWYLPREMKDPDYVLRKCTMAPITDAEAEELRVKAEHSINAWCRDLLEVRTERRNLARSADNVALLRPKVDFLHRTVRDFLLLKDIQDSLDARIKSEFSPWLSLVRVHLFEAKSLAIRQGHTGEMRDFIDVAGNVMFFAKQCEVNTKKCPVVLIDELDRVGTHFGEIYNANVRHRSHWTVAFVECDCNFMAYAVSFGLALYMRQAFLRDPQLMKLTRSRLLNFALENRMNHELLEPSREPSLAVVQALLDNGADPNKVPRVRDDTDSLTPWQRYLRRCYKERSTSLWPTARLLMLSGAHADASVEIHGRDSDSGGVRIRLGEAFQPVPTSARICLRRCFEGGDGVMSPLPDDMERLLQEGSSEKGITEMLWSGLASVWK